MRTPPLLHPISMSRRRVLPALAASGGIVSSHSFAAFVTRSAQASLRLNTGVGCKWREQARRRSSRRRRLVQMLQELTSAILRHQATSPTSRSPPPSTSQRCRHPRARAHTTQPALIVPQELRERALRFVRADGALEVIIKEKALPETPPNALLVLCLDAVG